MRRAARKDANHNEIADAFRKFGCSVLDLSRVGEGCPDMLLSISNKTALVEVKTKTGRMTAAQKKFLTDWRGRSFVVRDIGQVPSVVKALRGF